MHFPEHMVNMVTGHGKDEETMCAEYKVSSVQVQKISNQFKTLEQLLTSILTLTGAFTYGTHTHSC